MTDGLVFTHTDAWTGGFYELAIELGETSDSRVRDLLQNLWALHGLDGPYLSRLCEPTGPPLVDDVPLGVHTYGVVRTAPYENVACGAVPIRLEDGDWLHFYIPLGSLGRVVPVGGFPFDGADHESWRRPLDRWLASLGRTLFARAAFRMALVGFETGTPEHLDAARVRRDGVPGRRMDAILVPTDGGIQLHERTER